MAIYAIGDIHGCNQTFNQLLTQINLLPTDTLVLVGDYVDRGADSKGVFDTIFDLEARGYDIRCIRGNHEQMLLDALDRERASFRFFLSGGGQATVDSFGVDHPNDIPAKYLDFINTLPYYLEIDNFIFVHGGLDFTIKDPLKNKDDMLWERYWYDKINYQWLGKRIIVHGHTPTAVDSAFLQVELIRDAKGQVLNLDTGCVFRNRKGLGIMSAINLTEMQLHIIKNRED